MITIEELVKKAKNNNINAYFELILFIQDTLYKIAKSRLQNEEDIKDVVEKLTNEMINHAQNLEFEKAVELRDKIKQLEDII